MRPGPKLAAFRGLVIVTGASLFAPSYLMPFTGLDGSWMLALQQAILGDLAFGREFVFTYGPFGFVAAPLFHPEFVATQLLFTAACVLLWWRTMTLAPSRGPSWALLATLLAFAAPSRDGALLLVVGVVFVHALMRPGRVSRASMLLLALLAHSKFSLLPAVVAVPLLLDASRQDRSDPWPWHSAIFVGGFTLLFRLMGQTWAGIGDYLRGAFEMMAGYGEAMSLAHHEALGAIALGVGLGLTTFVVRQAGVASSAGRPSRALLTGSLVIVFVAWKSTFVRYDPSHMRVTGYLLLLCGYLGVILTVLRPARQDPSPAASRVVTGLLLASALGVTWIEAGPSDRWRPDKAVPARMGRIAARQAQWLRQLTPSAYDGLEERRRAAMQTLRENGAPLPDAEGLDVYPWELSELIASDVPYAPRPIPQTYTAYTPRLQELNARHLASADAAAALIVDPRDIDDRLPGLLLGPGLLEILGRYEATEATPRGVVFRRRLRTAASQNTEDGAIMAAPAATPFAIAMGDPVRISARLDGPWIALPEPAEGEFLVASMEIRPTPVGGVLSLLYTWPLVEIELELSDGGRVWHRFIPRAGTRGFVLSPHLAGPLDLARLTGLGERERLVTVERLRFHSSRRRWPGYDRDPFDCTIRSARMLEASGFR